MRTLNFTSFLKLLLLTVLVALQACVLNATEQAAIDDAFNPDFSTPGDVTMPPPPPSCYQQRYVQPPAQITRKIDLLFVMDTSGSLDDERQDIIDGIDAFVGALPAEVDYQIGVVLAHGGSSTWAGRLYQKSTEPKVLKSSTSSLATIRSQLRTKLTGPTGDNATDGGEIGMYSLNRMLTDRLPEAQGLGFFRNDAALAVVQVSDEQDICAVAPTGVTFVPDPQRSENTAKSQYCNGITPASVLNNLRGVKGEMPLLVSGIIYSNPATVPAGGENEVGYGHLEMIQLAKGLVVDLADGHIQSGLANIGSLATVRMNLKSDFTLAEPRVDPTSIRAYVDGAHAQFSFIKPTNVVHIPNPGTALSTIDISYCQLPETDPGTGPGGPIFDN